MSVDRTDLERNIAEHIKLAQKMSSKNIPASQREKICRLHTRAAEKAERKHNRNK